MARVLVGVTGGIAAYKACSLVRMFVRAGHDVFPLVTPGAERFVRAETFFALARRSPSEDPYQHLERGDVLAGAPLAPTWWPQLPPGVGDTGGGRPAFAHAGRGRAPPAMNTRMW